MEPDAGQPAEPAMTKPMLFSLLAFLPLLATAQPRDFPSEKGVLRVHTVAQGLEHPWAIAFLSDGRLLVTERSGRMRIVAADGGLSPPLTGVPAVRAQGQGGLMDVALSPAFADDRLVYFSYSEPGEGNTQGTALARARLADQGLEDVEVIFRQVPKLRGHHHFGSRIVFADDGTLFLVLGDRGERDRSQQLNSHVGTVVRILPDGGVPADNPFVGRAGALPEIWSYGHRNQQGAALNPWTRALWSHEHGPRGGDEINIPEAGKNYGWPVITYGREYHGPRIGPTHKEGMEQPIHQWTPSIAPSGMAFHDHEGNPAWRGNLFVGALAGQHVARLELDGSRVVHEERMLGELGERIRDVRIGPEGDLYLATDSPRGRVLRVELLTF
jgi:glucose/arabinose dehydrogenase